MAFLGCVVGWHRAERDADAVSDSDSGIRTPLSNGCEEMGVFG